MKDKTRYTNIISQSATVSQVSSFINKTIDHMKSLEHFVQRNSGLELTPYQKLLMNKLTWFEKES